MNRWVTYELVAFIFRLVCYVNVFYDTSPLSSWVCIVCSYVVCVVYVVSAVRKAMWCPNTINIVSYDRLWSRTIEKASIHRKEVDGMFRSSGNNVVIIKRRQVWSLEARPSFNTS